MSRSSVFAFALFIAATSPWATSTAVGPSTPVGQLHKTDVAAHRDPLIAKCDYQLWIPDDTKAIRTIFVVNMRAAGKRLFKDPQWRAMAVRNSAAMMYCEFEAKSVRDNGYGLSILKACDQFAQNLNRPELKHAPFVLWGHSMGGRVAQDFVRFRPTRVLAFHIALRANPTPKELMEEEPEAMGVPGLYLMGAEDKKPSDIREHFRRARRNDSPRAWVWLPGQSHWPNGMSFKKDETSVADWSGCVVFQVL
ncbi:alpha/beta hydrolase [bacterium]|nr:alpha/beta hydrolase [bacterium]